MDYKEMIVERRKGMMKRNEEGNDEGNGGMK